MRPAKFLLVEDDRIDAKAFVRTMTDLNIGNPLSIVRDGVEAWELLCGQGPEAAAAPRPDVVFLDLNMPRMSGIELLRKIRSEGSLQELVVYVLTTSNDDRDRIEAHDLNVAGYLLKSELERGLHQAAESVTGHRPLRGPLNTPEPVAAAD